MKQVKVYAGQETMGKWGAIKARFTSNTAAFAAMVEVYHAQMEVKAMDERIEIVVSEDSLFGGWENMDHYDAHQSLIEYTEMLSDRLMQEWTRTVSVTDGIMDSVKLGDDNQDDRPEVDAIIAEVYESFEWVRYSDAGKAAGGVDGKA